MPVDLLGPITCPTYSTKPLNHGLMVYVLVR